MDRITIEVKKEYHKAEVDKKLSRRKSKKLFDARRFAGRIAWEEDPLAYQKRIRDEWD